jgi:hypothetical protein
VCGLCDSPIFGSVDRVDRDSFFKFLRSPGFDSKETIPPGWESIPGLLKRFTNTGSSGPVRQPYSTRFIAPLDCYKIPAQSTRLSLQSSDLAPLANSPVSKCCPPPLWCQGGKDTLAGGREGSQFERRDRHSGIVQYNPSTVDEVDKKFLHLHKFSFLRSKFLKISCSF